ncbi:MAG: glycosyltransferase, partial [Acidobacteria bacterium]|nr:glycosyltransferase [Acidobacteriota bacterium]
LVGFAASFARFHGLDQLEHAIVEVAKRCPQAHFVLAGSGPGAEDLRRRLHQNVTFLGHVPHDRMPGVLAAMDVLVAPYAPEGFFYFSPIKLFEYMACGRAVLAARTGQIAEVIEDRHNGLLYNPADPDDFVKKLLSLLRDPARRALLGAQARRTIQNHYTWDHNARRVNAVLEHVRIQNTEHRRQNVC